MLRLRVPALIALLVLTSVASIAGTGCTRYIANTTVPDTSENRTILRFMETYRHAVEERNVGALLAMTDALYLDEVGTPTGEDDLDYGTLQGRLSAWASRVVEIRFEIRYHRVAIEGNRITVEYRYTASFKMPNSNGEDRWSRRVADARAVLSRDPDSGDLRFLAGL